MLSSLIQILVDCLDCYRFRLCFLFRSFLTCFHVFHVFKDCAILFFRFCTELTVAQVGVSPENFHTCTPLAATNCVGWFWFFLLFSDV